MPSPAATAILNFGKLLWESSKAQRDEAKIGEVQEKLIWSLVSEKSSLLRASLRYNNAGINVEPMVLRAVSLVSYTTLCSARNAPTVAEIACAIAGDDPAKILEARETLSGLCVRGELVLAHKGGSNLQLGQRMLDYFAGGANTPPLVITESNLQQAMQGRTRPPTAQKRKTPARSPSFGNLPTAKALAQEISTVVIGLDQQVRTLSVRLALHMRRSQLIVGGRDPGSPNECLMFIGPSGCGKTWLAENAGRIGELPYASVSSGDLTAQGYVGVNVDETFRPLLAACSGNTEMARFGLMFYDEWDKKACRESTTRDVGGVCVQNEMLRLMEGCDVQVGGRRGGHDCVGVPFNTRGLMFLFGGAFVGLDDILGKRLTGGIGFGSGEQQSKRATALYDALEQFGMIPEFLNRLTGILVFPEPTVEQLIEIANQSVLPTFNRLLATCQMQIKVTQDAVALMAEAGWSSKTFARGLKSIVSRLTEELVFEEIQGSVRIGIKEVEAAITACGLATGSDPGKQLEHRNSVSSQDLAVV